MRFLFFIQMLTFIDQSHKKTPLHHLYNASKCTFRANQYIFIKCNIYDYKKGNHLVFTVFCPLLSVKTKDRDHTEPTVVNLPTLKE